MSRRTSLLLAISLLLAAHSTGSGQSKFLRRFSLTPPGGATSTLLPSNSISQTVLTPSALWIGTSKGVASTTDLGRHWTSFRSDPAFTNDGIYALAATGSTLWASTGYDKEISDGTVQTGSGYAWSTDAGATWHHVGQTLDTQADSIIAFGINDSLRILPVTVPEQNVTFDISLTPTTTWIASWASGLRKTIDTGRTWQRMILPSDVQSSISDSDTLWTYAPTDTLHLRRMFPRYDPRRNNNYLAFSVLAVDDDTIWCGTAGGVNKTTDGGRSWRKFSHQNQAAPILGNWVIAIGEQRYGGRDRIWVTNWQADDPAEDFGVSYTDDWGDSWRTFLPGVKAYDFAFNPSNGAAYIASDNGIYRTTDGGSTFALVSSIADPANNIIIARSAVYTVTVAGDTVVVGTSDGLAYTIDDVNHPFGQSWVLERSYIPVGTSGASYAYPNPFSPRFQVSRIHYAPASTGTSNVTIEIYDFGMNRVRTLLHDAPRPGGTEYDEVWDGTRDDGSAVTNGVYFYRITIDDREPLYGKILLLQ